MLDNDKVQIIFMFPGQGLQYTNMCLGLYQECSIFKHYANLFFDILDKNFKIDLKEIIFSKVSSNQTNKLDSIVLSSCSTLMCEYALAMTLIDQNIVPNAMIGYSIGEYVAACISRCVSLDDMIEMSVVRSQLLAKSPPGKMVAIPMNEREITHLLSKELSVAAELGASCVVSGSIDAINAFSRQLAEKKIFTQPLKIDCAGHSALLDEVLPEFIMYCSKIKFKRNIIPFISNVTGEFITMKQCTDPYYWTQQMRQPVKFAKGLNTLLRATNLLFLEVGVGNTLTIQLLQMEAGERFNIYNLVQSKITDITDYVYFTNQLEKIHSKISLEQSIKFLEERCNYQNK